MRMYLMHDSCVIVLWLTCSQLGIRTLSKLRTLCGLEGEYVREELYFSLSCYVALLLNLG